MGWKMPFQFFPGIFSSIDSYTKKITHFYFEKYGVLPPWLSDLGTKPIDVPSLNEFTTVHKTGLTIRGVPDDIFKNKNSFTIVDYKTAAVTENADKFLPVYDTQLNAYAYIAEAIGIKPVKNLSLVYYPPQTDIGPRDIRRLTADDTMVMKFRPQVFEVKINRKLIDDSAKKVCEIINLKSPPANNGHCDNCDKLEELMEILEI